MQRVFVSVFVAAVLILPMTIASAVGASCQGVKASIAGTPNNDRLAGTGSLDVITGLGGHDLIRVLSGNDRVCGSSGNDQIYDGYGSDVVYGGNGYDTLYLCDDNAHDYPVNGVENFVGPHPAYC